MKNLYCRADSIGFSEMEMKMYNNLLDYFDKSMLRTVSKSKLYDVWLIVKNLEDVRIVLEETTI